jgi:hypothetical protein
MVPIRQHVFGGRQTFQQRPCADIITRLVRRQERPDTGWTSQLAQCHLHASAGRDPAQCRPESKIRSACCCREGKKVAITAVMRKLFVLANALLRDHRKWVEKRLDQDGYSSRSRRTSLRRRSFSFLTSSCGPDIKSSCSLSGHCYAIPCRATDTSEPTCSKSKDPRLNLMKLAVVLSRC